MRFIFRPFSTPIFLKSQIQLTPSEEQLFNTLSAHLPGTQLRVAGGWVRDKLLNLESFDIDITLDNLTGVQAANKLKSLIPSTSSMGTIRANPEASKHLETACLKLLNYQLDFANLRTEAYTDSRIPKTSFGSPLEDAYRRDLTINSLFYNISQDTIEDWTGLGFKDLNEKIARTPLDPAETFHDDPLRVLRVIRFASRFGLRICPEVEKAIKDSRIKDSIEAKVSRERVKIEYEKMTEGNNPNKAVELLEIFELFPVIFGFPIEVKDAVRTLPDLSCKSKRLEKYTSALLIHFAPEKLTIGNNTIQTSSFVCSRSLKLSKRSTRLIEDYIRHYKSFLSLSQNFDLSETALILKDLGPDWPDILDLLPEKASSRVLQSIHSAKLLDFASEELLLKGDEIIFLLNIAPYKVSYFIREAIKWQGKNRSGSKESLKSYLLSIKDA